MTLMLQREMVGQLYIKEEKKQREESVEKAIPCILVQILYLIDFDVLNNHTDAII